MLDSDEDSIQANILMAQALLKLGKHEELTTELMREGITFMERALELTSHTNDQAL